MTTKSKIFIAYAREDDARFVDDLFADLKSLNFDVSSAHPMMEMSNSDVMDLLRQTIIDSDQIILVIGPNARTSFIVRWAWAYAWQYCKAIIPVLRLDSSLELPTSLQGIDYVDFRNNRRYEFARDELLSILDVPLPKVGALHDVPVLPRYHVPRDEALDAVKEALLNDTAPVTISPSLKSDDAIDVGGLGKTVVATTVAYDCEIRTAFSDGIFWVTLGENPNIPLLQSHLIELATGTAYPCLDGDDGKEKLREIFRNKAALVILDDAREYDHVHAFNVANSRCGLLITTRQIGMSDQLKALDYGLAPMSDEVAARLLAIASGQKLKSLPAVTQEIMRFCNGYPLPLAILGATLRGKPIGWGVTLTRLKTMKLPKSPLNGDSTPESDNIFKVIGLSVEMAREDLDNPDLPLMKIYSDLAAIQPETSIPLAVVIQLWNSHQPSGTTGGQLMGIMVDRFLVQSDDNNHIRLHKLLWQYIQAQNEAVHETHKRLLMTYRQKCANGQWHTGPNDGYFFENLINHLLKGDEQQQAIHLLASYEWLKAKLHANNISEVLADYDRVLQAGFVTDAAPRRPNGDKISLDDIRLIRDALQLSASILAEDKSQLAAQLLGRLLDQDAPPLQNLLEVARNSQAEPWLRPLVASLTEPRNRGRSSLNIQSSVLPHPLIISPDGMRAIIASRRNTIQIWNLSTGAKEQALQGHVAAVRALAITPDGNRLASAGDDFSIILWDMQTGKQIRTIKGHTGPVWCLAFSPDGKLLASGSMDKTIKFWDELGICRHSLTGHTSEVSSISFTPDGRYLASASHDRTLKLWSLEDNSLKKTFRGHAHWVHHVRITPDAKKLISSSRDKTIRIWDIESGVEEATLTGHTDAVHQITLSPMGDKIFSASRDRSIKSWRISPPAEINTVLDDYAVSALEILPNGNTLMVTTGENSFTLLDIASGIENLSFSSHSSRINRARVIPQQEHIITASWDGTLKLWHPQTGAVLRTLRDHSGGVQTLSVTSDGKYAVSGSWDNTLKVWNLQDGSVLYTLKAHIEGITASAVTEDRQYLVAASSDNLVTVWDLVTGSRTFSLRGHNEPITALSLTPDSKCAVSASLDGSLILWDILGGDIRQQFEGHAGGVNTLLMLPDGQYLLSGGRDHAIHLWNMVTGKIERSFLGHEGWVNALLLTPDSKQLISASDDGTVKFWSMDDGTVIRTLTGHRHWVWDLALSPQEKRLFTVSSDHSVKVWDVTTGACLVTYTADSPLLTCAVTHDGQVVAVGAQSGQLHLLKLENFT